VSPQYRFIPETTISHYDSGKYPGSENPYGFGGLNHYTGFLIRRHFYIEDHFYTISNNQIYINSLTDFGVVAKLYVANRNATVDPSPVEIAQLA